MQIFLLFLFFFCWRHEEHQHIWSSGEHFRGRKVGEAGRKEPVWGRSLRAKRPRDGGGAGCTEQSPESGQAGLGKERLRPRSGNRWQKGAYTKQLIIVCRQPSSPSPEALTSLKHSEMGRIWITPRKDISSHFWFALLIRILERGSWKEICPNGLNIF